MSLWLSQLSAKGISCVVDRSYMCRFSQSGCRFDAIGTGHIGMHPLSRSVETNCMLRDGDIIIFHSFDPIQPGDIRDSDDYSLQLILGMIPVSVVAAELSGRRASGVIDPDEFSRYCIALESPPTAVVAVPSSGNTAQHGIYGHTDAEGVSISALRQCAPDEMYAWLGDGTARFADNEPNSPFNEVTQGTWLTFHAYSVAELGASSAALPVVVTYPWVPGGAVTRSGNIADHAQLAFAEMLMPLRSDLRTVILWPRHEGIAAGSVGRLSNAVLVTRLHDRQVIRLPEGTLVEIIGASRSCVALQAFDKGRTRGFVYDPSGEVAFNPGGTTRTGVGIGRSVLSSVIRIARDTWRK
jgi:hypothetical protein